MANYADFSYFNRLLIEMGIFINPRMHAQQRVTIVIESVCLSVCLSVPPQSQKRQVLQNVLYERETMNFLS